MSERFSQTMRKRLAPLWEAQHAHPFVLAVADGSLPAERFLVWLRQDYLLLTEYARVLTLIAARAVDLDMMRTLNGMAHDVLESERLVHGAYALEFGLDNSTLAASPMLPTTRAYTDHLLRTGSLASYSEMAAAIVPHAWAGHEIAARLAASPPPGAYSRWVLARGGPEAASLARRARNLLDRFTAQAGPEVLARAEEAFALSTRYESMFWQMCWAGEAWPA